MKTRFASWIGSAGKLALISITASNTFSLEIVPQKYDVDRRPDSMSYDYSDQTGRQLIDGMYGGTQVGYNLGSGQAYEWVGWNVEDPVVNVDFTFDSVYTFNKVDLSSIQQGGLNNIVMPSFSLFSSLDGSPGSWSLIDSVLVPESLANDGRQTLSLDGLSVESQFLRVAITHSLNGPWSFSDEIDFFGTPTTTAVPDGGSSAAMLGMALLGVWGLRRRMGFKKLAGSCR